MECIQKVTKLSFHFSTIDSFFIFTFAALKMSLQIQHLTKVYGHQKAVDDISFSIEQGEIVGFLGPNGAGKSTTMKIATSYLPPSAGSVLVNGIDVVERPLEVRRITGYLPEHNPLYLDMYVHEYLQFVGKVHEIPSSSLKSRIDEMIDMCGLAHEQNKLIESLSKGYRQRVGLAQALLHDPKVLILDEPTSGLDPNQISEIRKVIKEISRNKTVIFSTHIMQEVQALCDRVIIINKGVIVADNQLSSLMNAHQQSVILIVEFNAPVDASELEQLAGVKSVTPHGKAYRLVTMPGMETRQEIFRFATEKNLSLIGLKQEENSLEEIFHSLTVAQATA